MDGHIADKLYNSVTICFCLFFCNRRNSLLSFGWPQLYNSEALPFTYDQYVVIELADKLYNYVTVCFCVRPWILIQINNFPSCRRQSSNHWPLDYKASDLALWGTIS